MYRLLVISFLFFSVQKLSAQLISTSVKSVFLGDKKVTIKIISKQGQNLVFAHVHENESASLAAGIAIIEKYGGKLLTLEHSTDGTKNRNITFNLHGTTYQFDPNRIYTHNDAVLSNSIKVASGKGAVTAEVSNIVKNLSTQIWDELKSSTQIIALHNNKNLPASYKTKWIFWKHIEPESYSIKSYIKSHDQSSDSNKSCSDIYINPEINNSEFFIVTKKIDFDLLVKKRYTVVLQNAHPVDDGSMSVYAASAGIRYINSEAKMGRVDTQLGMLELLLADGE